MRVNTPSTIAIQARDANGAALTSGGDTFTVTMQPRCAGCVYAPVVSVVDNGNGQYTGTFTATTVGEYDVQVALAIGSGAPTTVGTYLLQVSDGMFLPLARQR